MQLQEHLSCGTKAPTLSLNRTKPPAQTRLCDDEEGGDPKLLFILSSFWTSKSHSVHRHQTDPFIVIYKMRPQQQKKKTTLKRQNNKHLKLTPRFHGNICLTRTMRLPGSAERTNSPFVCLSTVFERVVCWEMRFSNTAHLSNSFVTAGGRSSGVFSQ